MSSVPKSQYDDLQKRHENMRKSREREQRRASKFEEERDRLAAELDAHIRESANMLAKAESARESCTLVPTKKLRKMQAEIATLKAELAALRAQEPVGYGLFDAEGVCHSIGKHPSSMTIDGKHFKSVRLFAELDAAREGEKK